MLTFPVFLYLKWQYVGDLQMELAFAYGSFGYGLSDQVDKVSLLVLLTLLLNEEWYLVATKMT